LVATALRLVAFGEVPPGLYHDEAYHGLDAVDILQGQLLFYFPANNGREPLFIYLIALAVGLLGRSPFALRLVAFFAGLLTVAATAAMGWELFSRRVGALAAAVLAVTLWPVHLSRVGFRAVLLPLFIALTAWQAMRGVRGAEARGRKGARAQARRAGWWCHWLAAGALYGLSFYTYTAARFTPVAVAVFGLYVLATQPAIRPWRRLRSAQAAIRGRLWRGVGLAVLAALMVVAPLAVYAVGHPGVVLGRLDQVSVLNPAINGGDLWGTLGAHTLRTLGMFFVRGDRIWRHNVPWRPIFDPLLGAAFILGLVAALRRARRAPATGFVLIWTAVMSLPTLLAEDAPHFLRAVGVLPVVVFLPALGLDWLADRVRLPSSGRLRPSAGRVAYGIGHWSLVIGHWLVLTFPLLFGLGSTAWAYFGDYARDPTAGYWFEQGAVVLAGRVNGFLGAGWDGERMVRENPRELGSVDRRVYVDPTLWEQWPQVRFLVAAPEAVTIGFEGEQIPNPQSPISNLQVAVFVWPYGNWQQAQQCLRSLLPAPAEVSVEEGPRSQGDRDPKPYTTYLAFFASTPDPAAPALARFSDGVELLGVAVMPVDAGRLRVRLRWRATAPLTEDYTVFLHYLRDGERVAQADSRPARGCYPTTVWRSGDVVNDDHDVEDVGAPLPGRDVLLFGLWQPESGAVLYLLDEAGNPAGDWIEVPVDGG
jgi:4-amino-4-deoxy-L-arabinose transferase-like glycosyltransferase